MKLSAILSAKSELANEIEYKIENLKSEIEHNITYYEGENSVMPDYVKEENEKINLKIKYYEAILKTVPGLN